jgi:uridine phosphorylase
LDKIARMQAIGESELILTPRGSIYHIDLKRDEMADTIITVGDPGRVAAVSKYFDKIEFTTQHREFVTHTGTIGNKRLTCISSGIGPDNIDIVLNELDAVANIDFTTRMVKPEKTSLNIFRLGTSGSLQEAIPVDSMVIGLMGLGFDNLMHYYDWENNAREQQLVNEISNFTGLYKTPIQPYAVEASADLIAHFKSEYHRGITATCPGFYAPQGRVVKAPLKFPNLVNQLTNFTFENTFISNFEMETSAIYGLGKLFGHRCLSINTIVANRVAKTFSKDPATAIDKMIKHSLEIIASIA